MKNLLLLLILISSSCIVSAQKRYVDVKIDLDSPKHMQQVFPGTKLAINTVLTNLGPDTLYTTDSMALLVFDAQGNVVIYQDGSNSAMYYYGFPCKRLEPGDTMHLKGPRLPIPLSAPGQQKYCVRAMPYTDSINSIWHLSKQTLSDTGLNSINNDSCVTILVIGMSVNDVQANASFDLSVYPNPAHSNATVTINMLKAGDMNLTIADISGRIVWSEQKENLPKGRQVVNINTSQLSAGVYLYKVSIGPGVVTGKLLIE